MTEKTDLRLVDGGDGGLPGRTGDASDPHDSGDPVPVSPDPFTQLVDEILERMDETNRTLGRMVEGLRG